MKPSMTNDEQTELEIRVLNHLEVGHNNAISLKNLCLKTGIKERKIRMVIESLRHEGYLVLFCPDIPMGYCLAATKQEVDIFMEYMRSRIIAECLILRNIKVAARKKFSHEFGQLPLI
jgi:biotin operon repressor